MPKKDLNQLAAFILAQATDEAPKPVETARAKAGKLGGLKGGTARAIKLNAEKKREIAVKAATTRWANRKSPVEP